MTSDKTTVDFVRRTVNGRRYASDAEFLKAAKSAGITLPTGAKLAGDHLLVAPA